MSAVLLQCVFCLQETAAGARVPWKAPIRPLRGVRRCVPERSLIKLRMGVRSGSARLRRCLLLNRCWCRLVRFCSGAKAVSHKTFEDFPPSWRELMVEKVCKHGADDLNIQLERVAAKDEAAHNPVHIRAEVAHVPRALKKRSVEATTWRLERRHDPTPLRQTRLVKEKCW